MNLAAVDPKAGSLAAKTLVATEHLARHVADVAEMLEAGNLLEAHKAACRAGIVGAVLPQLVDMLEERIASLPGTIPAMA